MSAEEPQAQQQVLYMAHHDTVRFSGPGGFAQMFMPYDHARAIATALGIPFVQA